MLYYFLIPSFAAAALVLYLLTNKYPSVPSWRTAIFSIFAIIFGAIVPDGVWVYSNLSFSDLTQCYLFLFGFHMFVRSLREFYEHQAWNRAVSYLYGGLIIITPVCLYIDPGYPTRSAVIASYMLSFSIIGAAVIYKKWSSKFLLGSSLLMVFAVGNSTIALPRMFLPFHVLPELFEAAFRMWTGAAILFFAAGHLINGLNFLMHSEAQDSLQSPKGCWLLSQADCALISPNGNLINLSISEFRVLELLFRNAPEPVSRKQLTIAITGTSNEKNIYSRALEVLVSRIRSRAKKNAEDLPVKSMRNIGYVFHGHGRLKN